MNETEVGRILTQLAEIQAALIGIRWLLSCGGWIQRKRDRKSRRVRTVMGSDRPFQFFHDDALCDVESESRPKNTLGGENGSNTRSRSGLGIPLPVSSTSI